MPASTGVSHPKPSRGRPRGQRHKRRRPRKSRPVASIQKLPERYRCANGFLKSRWRASTKKSRENRVAVAPPVERDPLRVLHFAPQWNRPDLTWLEDLRVMTKRSRSSAATRSEPFIGMRVRQTLLRVDYPVGKWFAQAATTHERCPARLGPRLTLNERMVAPGRLTTPVAAHGHQPLPGAYAAPRTVNSAPSCRGRPGRRRARGQRRASARPCRPASSGR